MQCEDCKSRCYKEGTTNCPFYEKSEFKTVGERLANAFRNNERITMPQDPWGLGLYDWGNSNASTSTFNAGNVYVDINGEVHYVIS